jgi:hypothetical protein
MSNWQFSQDNYVITHSPTAERDADQVTLFDVDGTVIISANLVNGKWQVCASDFYHDWVDFSDITHVSYTDAIKQMFMNISHDHEVSETGDFREVDIVWEENSTTTLATCELCGEEFQPFTEED